jgi:putative FmdB family regulatory protein
MIFEYKCQLCGDIFERDFPVGKAPDKVSCECAADAMAKRYYSAVSFSFKGNGSPTSNAKFNREMTARNERAAHRMRTERDKPKSLFTTE